MTGALPELRDIHLPPEPAIWPPAPGWWLLALLALAALGLALWRARRALLRRRRRQRLIDELEQLRPAGGDAAAVTQYLAGLSQFLRRLARAVRADTVSLRGDDWIRFLDRHGDGFHAYAGALTDAPYRPHAEVDTAALHALAQSHLRRVLATELRDV